MLSQNAKNRYLIGLLLSFVIPNIMARKHNITYLRNTINYALVLLIVTMVNESNSGVQRL